MSDRQKQRFALLEQHIQRMRDRGLTVQADLNARILLVMVKQREAIEAHAEAVKALCAVMGVRAE